MCVIRIKRNGFRPVIPGAKRSIKAGRFGAVIGDNVSAKNVAVNAGRKIWPNKAISGKTVSKDLK